MRFLSPLLTASLLLVYSHATSAQIAPANSVGVAAGHEHLRAQDVDTLEQFFRTLGARDGVVGRHPLSYVPGVALLYIGPNPNNPNTVSGGSEGTSVDAMGFKVKNLKDTLKNMAGAGYMPLSGTTAKLAYLMAPDGAKVELVQDKHLSTPIAANALVMKVPDVTAAAAWYEKWFGAKIARKGGEVYADIPGMGIRFEVPKQPVVSTRGHAIDHIGFEVENLEAFMKKLGDGGVKITVPYNTKLPEDFTPTLRSLAFIEDPWGTVIELNEGFRGLK